MAYLISLLFFTERYDIMLFPWNSHLEQLIINYQYYEHFDCVQVATHHINYLETFRI